MTDEKIFSTRDLGLAASLVSLKFFMISIDYQIEGSKNAPVGYFIFADTPQIREAEARFQQGLLVVEPKTLMANIKSLKARIQDMAYNPHNPVIEPHKSS
jgi:hypothetical protein